MNVSNGGQILTMSFNSGYMVLECLLWNRSAVICKTHIS